MFWGFIFLFPHILRILDDLDFDVQSCLDVSGDLVLDPALGSAPSYRATFLAGGISRPAGRLRVASLRQEAAGGSDGEGIAGPVTTVPLLILVSILHYICSFMLCFIIVS